LEKGVDAVADQIAANLQSPLSHGSEAIEGDQAPLETCKQRTAFFKTVVA